MSIAAFVEIASELKIITPPVFYWYCLLFLDLAHTQCKLCVRGWTGGFVCVCVCVVVLRLITTEQEYNVGN